MQPLMTRTPFQVSGAGQETLGTGSLITPLSICSFKAILIIENRARIFALPLVSRLMHWDIFRFRFFKVQGLCQGFRGMIHLL